MALRSLRSKGVDDVGGISCFEVGAEVGPVVSVLGVDASLLLDVGFGRVSFGLSFPFIVVVGGACVFHAGTDVLPDLPTLFSSSFFRLCISWPSSSSFASPFAFQPSSALGIWSFRA